MKMTLLRSLLPFALLAVASGPAAAQKVYKWYDEHGQVHYGDRIPPEYASQDRDILNRQGLPIGHEEGSETPEEKRVREAKEKQARLEQAAAQRDRMLLATYQNVEEIELLRARRLDQIDAQIMLQRQSLATLKARHAELLERASRFQPASDAPDALPMPDGLADDIERSESDIRTQQVNLDRRRRERVTLDAQFQADIARFKELHRIN
jgi:hypothetical protein